MNIDPQIGTSRSNSLQIPTTSVDGDGSYTSSYNNNDEFGNLTTTIFQPIVPEELSPIIVNQPTATMITPFRLGKSREEMSPKELIDFVISPVPQCQKVLCKITRSKEGFGKLYPQYELYIEEIVEAGEEEKKTFLLSARKRKNSKSSNYVITIDKLETGIIPKNTVGKVRSNFLGTAFAIYSNGRNPFKNEPNLDNKSPIREELGAVVYDPNILGFKGPRKMTVLLTGMTRSGQRPDFRPIKESQTLIGKFRNGDHRDILVLHNKSPQWNEETQSYVLNFNGRVTLASVKNFQIVHDNDLDYIIMQFGRVEEDTFTMDFMYPMCPLQAFAIALTSFDAKLAYNSTNSSNKEIAVITGGTRGIGYAISQKFAQNGIRCVILGRNKETIENSINNIMMINDLEHVGMVCDVRNYEEIVNNISKLGNINYLINAAGISSDNLVVKLKEQEINNIIQTNLFGTIFMCSNIVKYMIKQKQGGCIINISSVIGINGNVGQSVYAASKAGIIGFSKSLAKELGSRNIRVNIIAPGFIETDMISALHRFGKPEDIADAASYLAKAQFITGQIIIVDGCLNI
ncbi:521_t:CDS:10 [Diversispora eburnea]|uniref:521_t:CDS:1 n=1 Tax=Diversispora eburnea TaxID=1213867 RepID=A0A9N8UWT5_9GLOM|nr:521_t:CDS:10 [Diversispora eburnea]